MAVAIAMLLAGCGSSSSSSTSSSSSKNTTSTGSAGEATGSVSPGGSGITLTITGGSGNLNDVQCGKQEAFEHYAAPASVQYSGSVTPAPSGRWKVKLKLKQCKGSAFVEVGSQKIVGQPNGQFSGIFPISAAGAYSLRAQLESGSKPESPKLYLEVR